MHWYQQSIPDVLKNLDSRQEGLSTTEAAEKLKRAGLNELREGEENSIAKMLLSQFKDVMIFILLVAAVISGFIGDFTDTVVIIGIVILNALLGFFQEFRAGKAMQALKKMSVTNVKTLRDHEIRILPATHLVPGDVILLEAGNAVPADIRLIEAILLRTEEAALTGESQPVHKMTHAFNEDELPVADQTNMAFKGTLVVSGRGKGVVVATGMQTELGRIAEMLEQEETLTPLQQRMNSFGKYLSVLVLALCILFFIIEWLHGGDLVQMALTAISLAVAAIPEALPAVITISLALAAKRMIRKNTLIRKLPAVETLGAVTYICTDKTGTLTKNKMFVEKVFLNDKWCDRNLFLSKKPDEKITLFLHSLALNNDAVLDGDDHFSGDSTEIALKELASESGFEYGPFPRIAEIQFDPERKLMTTFHNFQNKIISFTKGAPDILLDRCVDVDKNKLLQQVDKMASKGLRILSFAYRYWDTLPGNPDASIHEDQLHFLGFVGMIDAPREEISDAVAQCRAAGIVPVMITGDHPLTAKAIAQRTGIVRDENDLVISGRQLAAMSLEEFLQKSEKIKVYARVSPDQKMKIVEALQKKGQLCGNDR